MKQGIRNEIIRFIQENPLNRFPDSGQAYFDEPLIGFATADDALFTAYKTIIGPFHQTPQEVLGGAASVVVWILPISKATRQSNRNQTHQPSLAWSQTRSFGDKVNVALRRHLVTWLEAQGQRAIAPQLAPNWQEFAETPVGAASNWSERHAAYAAGLGTFSLNDALITPKGIAHRCGSVVTDLPLRPNKRPYAHHQANFLRFHDGSCGACIARCPVAAISRAGHDKMRCRTYVYQTLIKELSESYGTPQPGCGLCQTKVPCEERIPVEK